jgi:hypothetical protein
MSSIVLYVNEKDLKESLNERFHEMNPQLPPSLTLSKIRNIKKSSLLGCLSLDIDVCTVAIGVILFERLCLKQLVTKFNRHLSMAVALLLAFKFNETDLTDTNHRKLNQLIQFIDREWEISRKELFSAEFGALVHLGFSLHVPHQHVFVVFTRLLKLVHKTSRGYLGDEMDDIVRSAQQFNDGNFCGS